MKRALMSGYACVVLLAGMQAAWVSKTAQMRDACDAGATPMFNAFDRKPIVPYPAPVHRAIVTGVMLRH